MSTRLQNGIPVGGTQYTRNGDGKMNSKLEFLCRQIFRPFTLPKNFLHFVLVFPIGERRVLLTFNGGGKFAIIFQ